MSEALGQVEEPTADVLSWEVDLAPAQTAAVIRQLAIALVTGIAFVWLVGLVAMASEGTLQEGGLWAWSRTLAAVLLVVALLAGLVLTTLYRRYRYRYDMDSEGITATTVGSTHRLNAIVNGALVLFGRPSAAGAGLLADSRQTERVRWAQAGGARLVPAQRQIELRQGRRTVMVIQCTDENWEQVSGAILQRFPRA